MTSSINSTTQSTTSAASSTTSNPSAVLGKDDFLKMLITQLKYQDPLNPLNGTEFAAQLAQFSSVEQLANIKTSLSQFLNTNVALTNSINNALATTFIGKEVRASTNSFTTSGEDSVSIGYELADAAEKVTVKIYDQSGALVKTLSGGTRKGENTLEWNGVNDDGLKVANGRYTFTIEALDSNAQTISSSSFIYGTVTGVRFKSDGTVFVIDGSEVSLADIVEIKER